MNNDFEHSKINSFLHRIEHKSHVLFAKDELQTFQIGDQGPMAVVFPRSVDDLQNWVKESYQKSAVINVWGSGIHQRIGGRVSAHDLAVVTSELSDIVNYEPDNMTVTIRCGTRLDDLQKHLLEANQFLAFNPPASGQATLGGLYATNVFGSLSHYFGTARDFLLGARILLSDGQIIKLGGKTVKNVAGYDLARLFVGSMGTLGIFTELTLKLWPLPGKMYRIKKQGTGLTDMDALREKAIQTHYPILSSVFSLEAETEASSISWNGFFYIDATHDQARTIKNALSDILSVASDDIEEIDGKEIISPFPIEDDFFKIEVDDVLLKWILPKASVAAAVQYAKNSNLTSILIYPNSGVVYAKYRADFNAPADLYEKQWQEWREHAHSIGGFLNIERAPDRLNSHFDLWDMNKLLLDWHKKIKNEFDPKGIFVSGRFAGGL